MVDVVARVEPEMVKRIDAVGLLEGSTLPVVLVRLVGLGVRGPIERAADWEVVVEVIL